MPHNLTLRSESGAVASGTGSLRQYAPLQRAGRATAFFLGGLLAALALCWVPILHLVWVPSMLLLGAGMAVFGWLTKSQIKGITGTCPSCSVDVQLDGGRYTERMHDTCPACDRLVFIGLATQEAS